MQVTSQYRNTILQVICSTLKLYFIIWDTARFPYSRHIDITVLTDTKWTICNNLKNQVRLEIFFLFLNCLSCKKYIIIYSCLVMLCTGCPRRHFFKVGSYKKTHIKKISLLIRIQTLENVILMLAALF